MRVERATLREVRLRLREPFATSRGVVDERRIVLVTLECGGIAGWGECVAGVDGSSRETVDGAWRHLERELLPRAVGRDFAHPSELVGPVGADERMAVAALEMAAWDLLARGRGVSLSQALGGTRASVPVGVSVGLQSSDERLAEVVGLHLAAGYQRVKVKIQPGRDFGMLEVLRSHFPTARLWADANAAYTLADVEQLRRLDELGLELLEQPLAVGDFEGHALLRGQLSTPICLDESITSEAEARRAVQLGACQVVNVKPGRLGGHAEALRVQETLHSAGVQVWCGGMLEAGVGRAHNLALASLSTFTLPGDISASRRYWERDLVSPELEVTEGHMRVPAGPGTGVDVDLDYVRATTVRETVVVERAQGGTGRMHQGQ